MLIASLGCGESSPAALPDPAPSDTVTPEVTPGEVAQTDTTPAPPPPALLRRGLVLPEDSIPCVTDDGESSDSCNHHGSSVTVTDDGTVLVTWYHGHREKSLDSKILWARLPPDAEEFEHWEVLYDEPERAQGNPVLWINDQTGDWQLFFITLFGPTWNDGQIKMITSADRGATWSPPAVLREELNWMVRNKPIRLSNGELLLPCYDEFLYTPTFLVSGDDFASSWEEIDMFFADPPAVGLIGKIQPTVLERDDNTLVALMRNENEQAEQRAWQFTSSDQGRTWSEASLSAVPNCGNSMEMIELRSGAWIIVFNNSHQRRFPLSVALSDDQGRTWSAVADIQAECPVERCSFGYPSIAQNPVDETIWVTYTHNRRAIGWVQLNERFVRESSSTFATPE